MQSIAIVNTTCSFNLDLVNTAVVARAADWIYAVIL